MISKKDKAMLIENLKKIDVKKFEQDDQTVSNRKWYRFGVFYGLRIACELIQALPEPATREKKKQETT